MAPPTKRRKTAQVEELKFDPDARDDYLTGFHKRKVQRTKHAQEQNAKLEKEEKVKQRKELREERKQDLERHVAEVNAILKKSHHDLHSDSEDSDAGSWDGIPSPPPQAPIDGTDEYIDEDKYTTVTIETLEDAKAFTNDSDDEAEQKMKAEDERKRVEAEKAMEEAKGLKKRWGKRDAKVREKKKKFRYESKVERKQTRSKQKSKNAAAAKARKGK